MLVFSRILLVASACWWAGFNVASAASATIEIDAAQAGPKVDPRFYGIFLEEINHGVDGGLYAELISNRAFEDAAPPEGFRLKNGRWVDGQGPSGMGYDAGFEHTTNSLPHWTLLQEGDGRGSMRLDMAQPLNVATPRSLRLQVDQVERGRVAVANDGFWGIAARADATYRLSFYARCTEGFAGRISIALEDAQGVSCTRPAVIKGVGRTWKKFTATLKGVRTEPQTRLVLAVDAPGVVWLDFVSLFPADTFKRRPNGLRADIAQMIADLKPGFVRFPGGCVVEGGTIETAYNWKYTVGPVEKRIEQWGTWNYRRTHGMGFLEYLQFCEDIGAAPLYVGFAGQTCIFREAEVLSMRQMGTVLDSFLDALEFANGKSNTRWGRVRSLQGHARPFHLNLVEIGNENAGKEFAERYRYLQTNLKAAHPEVSCIADLSWISRDLMKGNAFDIEDNHYYNSPAWFMANTELYARRDRQLPPVYVGEVAVTSEEGGPDKGNLLAALAEGAFLMGLERNADVVKMVSYAPLLGHVEGRSGWHAMIYHDSARVCGTVSYYLWKLFGQNRPDYTVATRVDFQPSRQPDLGGGIGVGTWDTAAEYRNIRVEKDGQTLLSPESARDSAPWRQEGGRWSSEDGVWRQADRVVGLSFRGEDAWENYTLSLEGRKLGGAEGFLIAFAVRGQDRFWWNLGGWGNRESGIEWNRSPVGRRVAGSVETGRWYRLKVVVQGRRIQCFLDDHLVHDETVPSRDRCFAEAGRDLRSGDWVLKIINTAPDAVATRVQLSGARLAQGQGTITTLSSARLGDNNSLDDPRKVQPKTQPFTATGSTLAYEAPPYSLSILRWPAEGR